MPEPDFKDELDPLANIATAAELQADLDVLMFLNDPQHTDASLAAALKEFVADAGQAAAGILERRGKVGALTRYSELGEIAGLDPKSMEALMQSGLRPDWLTKSPPSTSVKVSVAYLSALHAGALWWGPLLASFAWGSNPWLVANANAGDLGYCYGLKQKMYDDRIKPLERDVKRLEVKLEKLEKKPSTPQNQQQIAAVEKNLETADDKLAEALKPLEKLRDYADADDREHAWWIIRANVYEYIKALKADLRVQQARKAKAVNAGNAAEANKAQAAITGLQDSIKEWGDSITKTDAKVTAKQP
ncbi:hypothetical protein [Anderseniella sp. Alg231-50]|uniref:hypothetical protein n=1 Tax=Anderseniella sp. Alg231-50 TaxID=1922226 RepID=UPI000D54F5DF